MAWLATIEAAHQATERAIYRRLFDFMDPDFCAVIWDGRGDVRSGARAALVLSLVLLNGRFGHDPVVVLDHGE